MCLLSEGMKKGADAKDGVSSACPLQHTSLIVLSVVHQVGGGDDVVSPGGQSEEF